MSDPSLSQGQGDWHRPRDTTKNREESEVQKQQGGEMYYIPALLHSCDWLTHLNLHSCDWPSWQHIWTGKPDWLEKSKDEMKPQSLMAMTYEYDKPSSFGGNTSPWHPHGYRPKGRLGMHAGTDKTDTTKKNGNRGDRQFIHPIKTKQYHWTWRRVPSRKTLSSRIHPHSDWLIIC